MLRLTFFSSSSLDAQWIAYSSITETMKKKTKTTSKTKKELQVQQYFYLLVHGGVGEETQVSTKKLTNKGKTAHTKNIQEEKKRKEKKKNIKKKKEENESMN